MSNAGQAVLTVVGGVVGFYFGGPAGASLGMSLGGMAGSAIFPTDLGTVSGPRLQDLNVQTSEIGAPIPIVYGTYALRGNVIWAEAIHERMIKKKMGGKGGPTGKQKVYSYYATCAVGICEGPIGGILRIWADTKVIYDARPQFPDETLEVYNNRLAANGSLIGLRGAKGFQGTEFYLGTEDQAIDPTIESYEGVGNVSAFRGLAYVMFSWFPLEEYGNRIPNFRFEVCSACEGG